MNEQTHDGGPFAPYFKRMETIDGVTNLDLVHGCTMRDYFAGQALQGFCSDHAMLQATIGELTGTQTVAYVFAQSAYKAADEMLKARAAK